VGSVSIGVESPLQDEVRAMIAALNKLLLSLSPPDACFHMSVEEMAEHHTTVFVARDNGAAVALGAFRRHADGIGQVKRMYTLPAHQARGIGGRILAEIEALARKEGDRRLVLEAGLEHTHAGAWRVYERGGFSPCGRVLDYPDSPYCSFFEKTLAA
jgi:putative acetyltransferase